MEIVGWHGLTRGALRGAVRMPMYVALDRGLADAYAEGGGVVKVTYEARNPLVVRHGRQVRELLAGAPEGRFHPTHTAHAAGKVAARGHDALVVPPEAFDTDDEESWQWLRGTYGDPQAVLLDRRGIRGIEAFTDRRQRRP